MAPFVQQQLTAYPDALLQSLLWLQETSSSHALQLRGRLGTDSSLLAIKALLGHLIQGE